MNIHKSQLFWCELQGYYWFWHTGIWTGTSGDCSSFGGGWREKASAKNRWLHSLAPCSLQRPSRYCPATDRAQCRHWYHNGSCINCFTGWWFQMVSNMFFFHFIYGILWDVILPIDFHIFQDGYCTTNQFRFGVPGNTAWQRKKNTLQAVLHDQSVHGVVEP